MKRLALLLVIALFSFCHVHAATGLSQILFTNLDRADFSWDFSRAPSNIVQIANRVITPQQFGALANGTNNDAPAIQSAFDAAKAAHGGSVFFPAGIYRTLTPVVADSGIRIFGESLIGATSYSPMEWRGSQIRYEGTSGAVIEFTTGGAGYVYHPQMEDMRVSTAGQSPKPDGILLDGVSEGYFRNVQVNGGFTNGWTLKDVTLTKFDSIISTANDVGMLVHNSAAGGYLQDCEFAHLNFFQNAIAAVKVSGSIRNATFNHRCWFENQPYGWYVIADPLLNVMAVDKLVIDDCTVSVGDAATYPQSRSVFVDAGHTNGVALNGLVVRNSMFYNNQSSYAVEMLFTNNTSILTTAYDIELDSVKGYGIQTALLTNDWQNSEIYIHGGMWCFDGFSTGTLKPFNAGFGKIHNDILHFDYRDFSGSQLWNLPTASPNTFIEGMFGYTASTPHTPFWYDGTAIRYTALADSSGNLNLTGSRYIQFGSGVTLSSFANNVFIGGVNNPTLVLRDLAANEGTFTLNGTGELAIYSDTGKAIHFEPDLGSGSGLVYVDGAFRVPTLYANDGTFTNSLTLAGVTITSWPSGGGGTNGTTINPTDGVMPVRYNSSNFVNSGVSVLKTNASTTNYFTFDALTDPHYPALVFHGLGGTTGSVGMNAGNSGTDASLAGPNGVSFGWDAALVEFYSTNFIPSTPINLGSASHPWGIAYISSANFDQLNIGIVLVTNGLYSATLTVTNDITAGGSITTGAPSGGTAAAWKAGSYKTNSVSLITTNYIELEVGGVLRKLAVVQ